MTPPVASAGSRFLKVDDENVLDVNLFVWNTQGAPSGEYRIKGEAFVWEDASPFDNSLDVKEPLVLLPAGAALPPGKKDRGTAVAADPRWSRKPAAEYHLDLET